MSRIWGNPAGTVRKKIVDSKRFLRQKNIQGCLVMFKQALEAMDAGKLLPADRKKLDAEIEELLEELQNHPSFHDIFGPVTFSSSASTDVILSFIKQLIEVNTERLKSDLLDISAPPETIPDAEIPIKTGEIPAEEEAAEEAGQVPSFQKAADDALRMMEEGRYREAREFLRKSERLLEHVVNSLNEKGIGLRKSQDYGGAISEYKRVLNVHPDDEGIYYNIARAFYEKGDMEPARRNLESALRINPGFDEARRFLDYLNWLERGGKKISGPQGIFAGMNEAARRLFSKAGRKH
jgi:tetratricopeptide (TPR) repeat protein